MTALGLLVIAGLVLLAVSPTLIAGRAPQTHPHVVKASMVEGPVKAGQAWSEEALHKPARADNQKVLAPEAPGLLVVDVDAGGDDAMGLLLALRQEQLGRAGLRMLAITCTHGNTALANVRRNALKTLHIAGRLDIPVFSGANGSLILTPPGTDYFGKDGFGDFEYKDAPDPNDYIQKEHAVSALIRLVKEYPGEITLLALGPLTNLALATRLDPEFLDNLKQLVIMGGSSDGSGNASPASEFNFFLDPEANFIVFNSTKNQYKPIYLLPWDTVARRNLISIDWRLDTLGNVQSKFMDFLNKAERLQLENNKETGYWTSADPIAMAVLLRPDLILASEQHHVDAETGGKYSRGAIFVDNNDMIPPKNVIIIKSYDVEGYQELLLRNLS